MSRLERKPWTIISGSREGGFYKSTDGGETFTKITTGLPRELIGKANLAVTAAKPDRIYALIEALPGGGFYRSDDAGQTWALHWRRGRSMLQRPFYYTTLGADPTNADVVYAGAEGFFKSTDGGKTFASLRTPHGDNHDIWINPTEQQHHDPVERRRRERVDRRRPHVVVAEQPGDGGDLRRHGRQRSFRSRSTRAQQDTSTTIIMSSQADPMNRSDWRGGPGCETGPIMPHPRDPNIVYGSCKGQYEWMNLKTGQSQELLDRRAVALRQSVEGSDPAIPARVADGDVAARSGGPLLRVAVPAPHARQGRDVGKDLAGSHRERSVLPGRERRADHARRDRRGVLQHALRDHRVADSSAA